MALADQLGRLAIPGRVAPQENWHITTRFLGKVDRVTYERFLSALEQDLTVGSFHIGLGCLGAFPRAEKATVVWVGVSQGVIELSTLNRIAEEASVSAGLAPEERPFHAHLTLSRVRPPENASALGGIGLDVGWFCDQLEVLRSGPGRGGARYEALETFDLSG